MNTQILKSFIDRLGKIGIKVELMSNVPWIYLDKVNGNKVKEKYEGDHGFTAFWYPVRVGEQIKFTSIKEVFKMIRKYR